METPLEKGRWGLQAYLREEDPLLLTREDVMPYVNQLLFALAEDSPYEFLRVARDRVDSLYEGRYTYIIPASFLLISAIEHRAIECAKVLLLGRGGRELSAFGWSPYYDMQPIHLAASELLPEFVELLLKNLGQVDKRCLYHSADFFNMLPLNIAVRKLSEKISWAPTQSVYRLIFTLCGTMELEPGFRTISQLMRKSNLEQNREAFYDYAKDGKIIEMSIFLYVDAIAEFGIFKSLSYDEHLALHQSLAQNSSLHSKEEMCDVFDGNGVLESTDTNCVKTLLLLLQIFHQTNFSMLGFDVTCEVIANRIKDAGFDFVSGDLQNLGNNGAATESVRHKRMCGVLPGGPFNTLPTGAQFSYPRSKSPGCFRGISSAAQTFQASQMRHIISNQKHTQAGAEKAIFHGGPIAIFCSSRKMLPMFFSAISRRMV